MRGGGRVDKRAATLEVVRPVPQPAVERPFGVEYQGALLKLLLSDGGFSRHMAKHLKPAFFQNEAMSWAWAWALWFQEQYGSLPSMPTILEASGRLDQNVSRIIQIVLTTVRDQPVPDAVWVKDQAIDFVRRQIFRQAFIDGRDLFNAGRVDDAYDLMMNRMEVIHAIRDEVVERIWYAEGFADRFISRQNATYYGQLIGTGVAALDKLLDGVTIPGFLGVWLAHPKAGKTTLLVNFGAVALRSFERNVFHVVLEGNGRYVCDRYDTVFTDSLYRDVKRGEIDAGKYAYAFAELQRLRGKCVIRALTDAWEYNCAHVEGEMKELQAGYGWRPDLVVVDYCDLLNSRNPTENETRNQKEAFKDLKTLANRGYVVWTASQVQRPRDEEFDEVPDILKSRDIADCYAKIRIADFIGSINQTKSEREQGMMRLYAELCRDSAVGQLFYVAAHFDRMFIGGAVQPPPSLQPVQNVPAIGYGGGHGRFVQVSGRPA